MWQQRWAILVAGSGRSLLCNVWLSAWSQKHVVSSVRNNAWCILLCQSNAVQAQVPKQSWNSCRNWSKYLLFFPCHNPSWPGQRHNTVELFLAFSIFINSPKAIFVFWAWSCCWSLPLFSPSLQLHPSALCLCSYYSSALAHFSIPQTSFHFPRLC